MSASSTPSPAASLSRLEEAKANFSGLDLAPRLEQLGRDGWESLDEITLTVHLKWLGIFFRPVTPGRFMVRLRLPNGAIEARQLAVLAELVDRCGEHGSADITTRQNLQYNWIKLEQMPDLLADLADPAARSRQAELAR